MRKPLAVMLLAALLAFGGGCSTQDKGSREFIPGKGWVPS